MKVVKVKPEPIIQDDVQITLSHNHAKMLVTILLTSRPINIPKPWTNHASVEELDTFRCELANTLRSYGVDDTSVPD